MVLATYVFHFLQLILSIGRCIRLSCPPALSQRPSDTSHRSGSVPRGREALRAFSPLDVSSQHASYLTQIPSCLLLTAAFISIDSPRLSASAPNININEPNNTRSCGRQAEEDLATLSVVKGKHQYGLAWDSFAPKGECLVESILCLAHS